ncbi:MAG: 2-dehydro-3-deoxygalactonokinase [Aquabacterium sp.]|nr:2-dehydro-3-deoxygalactonokinase [Aquabacterium sp.]
MAAPALIAVDWGTSALRGALLAADGTVLALHAAPRGLLSVPPGGWQAAFDAEFGAWCAAHPGLPVLLAGMVGSRQGWAEAAYAPCPAGLDDIARQLLWLQPGRLAIVPGLSCDMGGVPDVMRGEETQVFGALQALPDATAAYTLVLPGTHSKWVQVEGGRIQGFATHMTGECYALLRQQSILARMLPADDADLDAAAFDAGVAQAQQPGGLLHHVFSVRTLALFDRAGGGALASRLSGLLIGEELRAQALPPGAPVTVLASPALAPRYQRALAQCGHPVHMAPADATWQGLLAVARAAGLLAAGTLAA